MKKLLTLGIAGIFTIFIIGIGIMSFYTGTQYARAEPEKFVIWEVDEVRVPVHHYDLIYIPDPIYYPEYIEVENETPILPRWPESLEEIEQWLLDNPVPLIGGWSLYHDPENDCEDIAERRMFMAAEDGLYLPVCPIYIGRLFDEKVSSPQAWKHVGNWFWLGNNFYFVEAQCSNPGIIKLKHTVKD